MAGNVVTGIVTCIHNEWDVDLMDTTQSYSAVFASATKRCTSPLKIVWSYNVLWLKSRWLVADQLFLPGTPVFSTNKTDRHDIIEILLKVAFNTITHDLWQTFEINITSFNDIWENVTITDDEKVNGSLHFKTHRFHFLCSKTVRKPRSFMQLF